MRVSRQRQLEQDDADDDEGEDAVPVLSDAAAQARLEAVKAAGLLPVCFTVRRGSGGSDAGDASDALPAHLLTVIQVLLMSSEEYGEWEAAGRILLGREYLDDEHLPHVVGALLELAERRLRALGAADVQLAVSGGAEDADAVPSAQAVASRFGKALRDAERAVLVHTFKRAVLTLEAAEDDEDDDSDEDSDEDDEDDVEPETGNKRRRTA